MEEVRPEMTEAGRELVRIATGEGSFGISAKSAWYAVRNLMAAGYRIELGGEGVMDETQIALKEVAELNGKLSGLKDEWYIKTILALVARYKKCDVCFGTGQVAVERSHGDVVEDCPQCRRGKK